MHNFFRLAVAIAVSETTGIIGALCTTPAIQSGWYAGLAKPALNPPAWVFGPVWTALYALMGISFFLVWEHYSLIRENKRIVSIWRLGVVLFFIQLALNALWSIIFFGLHRPGGALVDIVFLWLAILAASIAFYRISKPAAYLLVPYLLWVSFAAYLNYSIWLLN